MQGFLGQIMQTATSKYFSRIVLAQNLKEIDAQIKR
jgi:hypothetical protein